MRQRVSGSWGGSMAPADTNGSDIGSPMERLVGRWEDLPRMEAFTGLSGWASVFNVVFFVTRYSRYVSVHAVICSKNCTLLPFDGIFLRHSVL